MKKAITLLLSLTMICALSLTVFTACSENVTATAIEIVDPVTAYFVGDTIDYDSLSAKITYENNTTKTGTVKSLNLTVKEQADLSKAGETSYTVTYGALSYTVNITVSEAPEFITAFAMPAFYANYKTASKDRTSDESETRASFRKTGEVYEVGNVNKFIFRPTATALNDDNVAVNISDVKTNVKVYEKATADGEYVLIPDTDLEGIVTIENNTYKFSAESAGKYYKIEVSIDEEEYNVTSLRDSDKTITFECKVIGGGYNVYDQLGLSVMNDLTSYHWQKIWKCTVDSATYKITSDENSLKLEADDKPLCEYVGNVDWVILHTSLVLDADLLPDYYFWTEDTEGYATARDAISGNAEAQSKLVGSLRDGTGNGKWWYVMNLLDNGDVNLINYRVNMQKAFFSTSKVSVSGNYNGITTPTTASEGGRNFFTVCDMEGNKDNPLPHWQVFQMLQSGRDVTDDVFCMKNVAVTGNMKQQDSTDYTPAGLNMYNCFGSNIELDNVIGTGFYTMITCDSYGVTDIKFNDVKLYDAYSNMIYMWRTVASVNNCEFIGSGGPLFILCDGSTATPSTRGPVLTVDDVSVLQAYATGNESWYTLYNAQPLVQYIISNFETGIFNNVKKTVRFVKDSSGKMVPYKDGMSGEQYINFIAAMICEPSDLFQGLNSGMMLLNGTYKTVAKDGTVIDKFDLNNQYVQALRAQAGNDATKFAPILQTGENMMFTDGKGLYTLGASGAQPFNPATDGLSWATDTHNKLGIFMSAGVLSMSKNAPYFGVIVDCASYGM